MNAIDSTIVSNKANPLKNNSRLAYFPEIILTSAWAWCKTLKNS